MHPIPYRKSPMSSMADAPQPATSNEILEQILKELRDIKDILVNFTDDGFPLRNSIPNPELLASLITASALLSRTDPRINAEDLRQRLEAAQVIGSQLIQLADCYRRQTERIQLERLSQ